MHSVMSINHTSRPAPPTRSSMAVVSQENSEEKMEASFLSCSIEEEDILDNIEQNLVSGALTNSSSSHFSSDFRSYGDRFEVSAADPDNASLMFDPSLHEVRKPKNYDSPVPVNVDPFDEPLCSHQSRSKLSLSMHDLSKIPTYPLVSKQSNFSSETIQSQSITTVGSCPKSKDSGFPRSLSCLSLNSGRSYEHIQSKVKEYIKQIKAGNPAKRKLTYESPTSEKTCCEVGGKIYEESTPPRILVPIINKLKGELEEKDRMLLKLQENYDTLLMKYAAAENRIDHLRVNLVGNSFDLELPDNKKPKASPNVLLLPNLCGLHKESNYLDLRPEPPSELNLVGLRPLSNSSCLVDGLEEEIEPRLQHSPSNSATKVLKEKNGRYSFDPNRESEQVDSESHPFGSAVGAESPHERQTTTPNNDNMTRPLNHQVENPFVKVKRWQESLPSMHLIEPGVYDQFPGSDSGSESFHLKALDKTGYLFSDGSAVSLLSSSVNDKLLVDSHTTEDCLGEIDAINVQLAVASEGESVKSELSNPPPPLNSTSPSVASLMNDTDTDLDRLSMGNLIDDLSCHTSHSKDTKNVCHADNTNSVSTSVDSSSTFHCLKASNQRIGVKKCARNESSSVATSPLYHNRDIAKQNQSNTLFNTSPAQNKPYVSQVGLAQANDNTQNNLAQTHLPPIIAPLLHKSHLPSLPIIQPITKRLVSPEPSNSLLSFVNINVTKEIGETNSLCRKRLLGQKARLLLMEYLKNSDSRPTCNCCTNENPNRLACSRYTVCNESQKRKEKRDSFEDKNVSLLQCLDEMNQCAQTLRGKSEAIMEVLSKQLRES